MNNFHKTIIALLVLFFGTSVYFYQILPQTIITHWGVNGQPNGFSGLAEGLFLLPVLSLVIIGLFRLFANIDPVASANPRLHRLFDWLSVFIVAFFMYLQAWIVAVNLGVSVSMNQAIAPALGVLFYFIGAIIENAPRNWFLGIRTPWTLSSEKVWDKTNKLGAKLFKIIAILSLAMIFFSNQGFIALVFAIIIAFFYLVIYSYLEFRKGR